MSETETEISVENVTAAIDDADFNVEAFGSNVKINLKGLGQLSHRDVCKRLVKLADDLETAGLPADVRLSWQNREKVWVPYPHCWVNTPRPEAQAAAENTARLARLEDRMSSMLELMEKSVPPTPAETTDVVIEADENPL
jgi:hypothetical protein